MRSARLLKIPGLLCLAALCPGYELTGRIEPAAAVPVNLHGAVTPFSLSTESDGDGRFQFRKLPAGTYSLVILTEARGEAVQTVELSSGTVDSKGRLDILLRLDGKLESEGSRGTAATISTVLLSVPERAEREYAEAQKCLSRQDEKAAECAAAHLRQAVQIAPRFTAAWNQMGTIAYQMRRYSDAEANFRKALEGDPLAFEPMVNLGGVLLNLERPREALEYNKQAKARRPNDALANSQLGMTWLALNDSAQAEKYLKIAVQLDPAHFSHPQLSLAALYVARGDGEAALLQLRDFLQRHPDSPEADRVRREIASLSK